MGLGRWLLVSSIMQVVLVAGADRRAEACSPPVPLRYDIAAPSDGMTAVPLNTRVVVVWAGENAAGLTDDELAVGLRTAAGADVAVTIVRQERFAQTVIVATPDAILDPFTTYDVLVRGVVSGATPSATPEVAGTFTTGEALDQEPPQLTGAITISSWAEVCAGDCSCDWDFGDVIAHLTWPDASDATTGAAVLYNVYREGVAEPEALVAHPQAFANHGCWGNDVERGPRDLSDEPGRLYVKALDLAGNEGGQTEDVWLAFDCSLAELRDDAGPTAGDAGDAHSDGGARADLDEGGGCSCTFARAAAPSHRHSLVWPALLAAALWLARSRRP